VLLAFYLVQSAAEGGFLQQPMTLSPRLFFAQIKQHMDLPNGQVARALLPSVQMARTAPSRQSPLPNPQKRAGKHKKYPDAHPASVPIPTPQSLIPASVMMLLRIVPADDAYRPRSRPLDAA